MHVRVCVLYRTAQSYSLTSSRSQAIKVADDATNCDGVSPDAMAAFTSNITGRPLPPSFLLTDLEPDTQYCLRAIASYIESNVFGIVESDIQAGPGTLHRTAGEFSRCCGLLYLCN